MLTIIIVIILVLWLFGNYAPVNSGRPYIGAGPYLGGGVGLLLVIVLVLALAGYIRI